MTQKELAEATGVSRSAVAQWETGRARHDAKNYEIAAALSVPVPAIAEPGSQYVFDQARMETDEADFVQRFRLLDRQDKAMVTRIMSRLLNPEGA